MSNIKNDSLTTRNHHIFWMPDDDEWIRGHLEEMEREGFRIAAMTNTNDGVCVAMVRHTPQ